MILSGFGKGVFFAFLSLVVTAGALKAQTVTFNTSGTFTVPAGVTSITVECWGGGGGGGRGYSNNGATGGGGGGGAYASSTLAVISGQTYSVVVGTGGTSPTNNNGNPGVASSFGTTLVVAAGGSGGSQATTNTAAAGGSGGTVAASTGTTRYAGGNGVAGINGTGTGACGGGGGAAASLSGAGANGNQCAGGVGIEPAGDGGSGSRNAVGGAGNTYGGGGAGGNRNSTSRVGGAGADGLVMVTYSIPGWYSYQTGVWNNPDNWTQDPTGTTLVNPFTTYPVAGDIVTILNGFQITNNLNNQALYSLTIEGGAILDMGATTGNDLGTISGSGLLRINGVALPGGTYTDFVAPTGGTIEYYNTGGTLPASQTVYNNLILSNATNSAITLISANDLTVNSNLNVVQTGGSGTVTWQINNATATQRTITLSGDLTVSANGLIRAGTGSPGTAHNLTIFGNLTNNGSIKFFDATFATLSEANYTSGNIYTSGLTGRAVNVTFSGLSNSTVTCNNQTDFYRLILNKGSGQQAMLTVNSSNVANFRIFGPNNLARSGTAPNVVSNNNLSILNGTLQLTGTINIPSLIVSIGGSNSWPIPQSGALWLNSPDVTVQVGSNAVEANKHVQVYGLLRISGGTLNLGYSRGLLGGGAGSLVVEGGTINTWQLRTTNTGTNNNFAYYQTGGTVNVGTPGLSGETITDYPSFALNYSTCTFQMSGGTLNVGNPTNGGTANTGGIQIAASSSSYLVTGGNVNIFLPASAVNFTITSTAPFYNLSISKLGAGTSEAVLNQISTYDGAATTVQPAQPLVVLNDLTLTTGNTPALNCNSNNLTVGGNFEIQANTTLTSGTNTVTFNGTGAQTWTSDGTINTLASSSLVVNKTSGILTLAGGNDIPTVGSIGSLILTAGRLNDGGKTLNVTSSLTNNAVHEGTGLINANGPTTIDGTNGTFGNLRIQTNGTVTVTGNQTITGILRLFSANSSLSIGSNSLKVLGNIYSNDATAVAFTNTKRIFTNGLRNDGGLTRQAASGVDLLFPVGSVAIAYTPATINTTATTSGLVTVRPVSVAHPNLTTANQSVQYYWRVTSSGFAGISSVNHKTYTYSTATRNAPGATYRAARYDPDTFTWGYSNTTYNSNAAPGTTIIAQGASPYAFNTSSGWTNVTGTRLDGEYTAGNVAAFGLVTVYFSRASTNWSLGTTWSTDAVLKHTGPAAGSAPCATCPVVIGDGASNNHVVTNDANNQTCGSLFIASGSTLDCVSATGLNFGVNTSGTGTLRRSTSSFPAGDFTDFIASGGGTVEYYGNSYTIPTTGPAPQSLNLINYNNLVISPNAGQTITLPLLPILTIYNDLTISGIGTGQVSTNVTATSTRTIVVQRDLNVQSGRLNLANNGSANASIFTITGNTTINNGAFLTVNAAGTAATHTITTLGSIINNGTLDLNGGGSRVANITFNGSTNTSLSGANAGGADLNLILVDKGSSQTPTLTFDMGGAVTTLSNNWLTLQNGTFNHNRTGAITLTNSGTNPFSIPASAKLQVQAGTVNISDVADNNSDLLLAGTIEVSGGALNVGPAIPGNNNDIEYASAGTPTIIVSSGSLYVNGSIRRATTSLSGALVYDQSGGTVTVGGRASENTRGVFEIENNSGSSFSLTGTGTLTVERPSGGTSFPDLYVNPSTSNVAATSTIQIGSNTLGAQTLDFSIVPTIGNMTILGAAGNAQTVNMESNTLTVGGTLAINTASTLNTNSLNVTIGGDLTISGTGIYNGSNNTTTFNGAGAQTGALTATSNFNNITINKPSGTATLNGNTSITDLNILSGILSNSGTLNVNGNMVNNSSQVGTGFIELTGSATTHTITSSNGSFTNLTLGAGAVTKNVTVVGDMTINGVLNFAVANRYLTIGSNKLEFSSAATVTGASSTAFVRTNGVASDLGVVRNWPIGSTSFTYPLGTGTSYIPIAFSLTASVAGPLTIVPIAQRHPTYNVASAERILNYYWVVTRGSTLAYTNTGSHVYSYASSMLSGTGGTLVAGLLDLSNPTGWTTSAHGGTANTTTMTYTNSLNLNLPAAGNTFHYTVGTVNTLPNPIVPVYSRLTDGSVSNPAVGGAWNSVNSWTTSPTGFGAAVASPPTGVPVVILSGARVNMTTNARTAFTSTINGTLVLGSTVAHNLGNISGTGTLRTATNTFPAGNYTAFVAATGGTIEYVAPMTMNNRNLYNNLSVIGAGNITMTNTDLTLNGTLTVASGVTLLNTNNRNISVSRDWINNGSFTSGTGTISLTGSSSQSVQGNSTLYNMVINKPSGNVTLSGTGTTTVTNNISLQNGHVISSSTHLIVLNSATTLTGGSATSFVAGPVRKTMNAGTSLTFPLGSITPNRYRPASINTTSGADTWTLRYAANSPSNDGYSNVVMNTANIGTVSQYEYWEISRTGGSTAGVTLSYNTGSYDPPNIGTLANLRVAHWDGVQWDLPTGGGVHSQAGTNITGTVSVTNVTNFSPFAISSTDTFSPLPVELYKFWATAVSDGVDLFWETASEINNDYFTVERSATGEVFTSIGTVKGKGTTNQRSKYTIKDANPFYGTSYYRLKQTDYDGSITYSKVIAVNYEGISIRFLNVYPNPTNGNEVTIEVKGLTDSEEIPVVIIDPLGRECYFTILKPDGTGTVTREVTFDKPLSDGVYTVKSGSTLGQIKRLVVINRKTN